MTVIKPVPMVISRIERVSARLRPLRSPYAPRKIAPTGRARNEIPNVPKVTRSDTASLAAGKNTLEMVTAK